MRSRIPFVVLVISMAVCAPAALAQQAEADKWFFRVTPYLWATDLNGTNTVGIVTVPIDAPFSDLAENLDSAFSVHFEFGKNRWTGAIDWADIRLKSAMSMDDLTIIGIVEVDSRFSINMGELWASYRFTELDNRNAVELLFGLRYNRQAQDLLVTSQGGIVETDLSGGFDEDWVDPIIGARYWRPLGKKERFWVNARVDLSARVSSDEAVNIQFGGGWNISKLVGLAFQYRYLDMEYDNGESGADFWALDLTQQGVLLGVAFRL